MTPPSPMTLPGPETTCFICSSDTDLDYCTRCRLPVCFACVAAKRHGVTSLRHWRRENVPVGLGRWRPLDEPSD